MDNRVNIWLDFNNFRKLEKPHRFAVSCICFAWLVKMSICGFKNDETVMIQQTFLFDTWNLTAVILVKMKWKLLLNCKIKQLKVKLKLFFYTLLFMNNIMTRALEHIFYSRCAFYRATEKCTSQVPQAHRHDVCRRLKGGF